MIISGKGLEHIQLSPVGKQVPSETPPVCRARRFVLTYDYSRVRPHHKRNDGKRSVEGVQFYSGLVALEDKQGFENMGELEIVFGLRGQYSIAWIDEK